MWSKGFLPSNPDGYNPALANTVAIDAFGPIVLGGSMRTAGRFGTVSLPGAGSTVQTSTYDAFVVRFDGSGNARSGGRWGGTGDDKIKSLHVDAAGAVYAAGSYGKPFGSIGSQLGLEDILAVGIKP